MEVPSSKIYWLMLLYGIQGVPYGFQVAFLPILLHAGGASLTKVSLLRALNLPWMLKLLWVPMVTSSASIKRPMTLSLTGLSVVFAASSMISTESVWILSSVLFTINVLASVQDLAVDTFAIQNLTEREMGMGNAVQVVAYKVGAMFGGGVLTWMSQFYSWSLLMLCVAAVYLINVIVIYLGLPAPTSESDKTEELDEKKIPKNSVILNNSPQNLFKDDQDKECLSNLREKHNSTLTHKLPRDNINLVVQRPHRYNLRSSSVNQRNISSNSSSEHQFGTTIKQRGGSVRNALLGRNTKAEECAQAEKTSFTQNANQRTLYKDFESVVQVPSTPWLLLYLLIYKLGEQGVVSIFPLYLLDSGISTNQVAFWTGLLAQLVSIAGSLLGGWLLNHNTEKRSLSIELGSLCFWRFIAISILSFMIWLRSDVSPLLLCLPIYLILLLGGAITMATFTTMMTTSQRASRPSVQTLHHTTMATAEVLGKVVFTSLAGLLVDQLGYVAGFITFAGFSLLPLMPLYKITILGTNTIKETVHIKL